MAPTSEQAASTAELLSSLGCQVHLPDSATFEERIADYWSDYAKLRPWCIVQPRTAGEVSSIVVALAKNKVKFAIRSGGHTNWAGSNSIEDGVTVDLSLLASTTLKDKDSRVVSIGPGCRWRDVYSVLGEQGLTVAGGRDGHVGVGGLLTGGGMTYFTSRYGMACDNVVNFQVVLADGRIVEANPEENPDLFQVLKGGGNNFGIVTRFDMQAFENHKIWAGPVIHPKQSTAKLAEAFVEFTDTHEANVDSTWVGLWTYNPQAKDIIVFCLHANLDGCDDGKAFDAFTGAGPCQAMTHETTMAGFSREVSLPPGQREIWFTLTFKNDIRIVNKTLALHEELVEKYKTIMPDGNFQTQCILQPLPTLFARHSVGKGGNVMGLDSVTDNAVLWLGTVSVPTLELGNAVEGPLKQMTADIEAFAKGVDGDVPWRYLNYADPSQKVLESYGEDNVQKIRDAAAKYDPEGVFQRLVPGGFKISKVAV